MQRNLRSLLLLAALLAAMAGLTACGGGEKAGEAVDSDASVSELLDKTFTGDKKLDSGKIDLKLKMDIQGGGQVSGPIDISLSGPFQSQGKGKLPQLDIDAAFSGAGQNIKAGIMTTGEKGYVNFNGQEYVVSDELFSQFKTGYEQAASKGGKDSNPSLATLGINPKGWLTDAKNAGEAKVGDADTIKITGGVDIGKLLDDINTALSKAGSLGIQGSAQLPTKITDEQKAQIEEAVKDVGVEIYTGKDDSLLRRMKIDLKVDDAQAKADITFDMSLTGVNEDQEFDEPSGAKPFEELLGQLGNFIPGLGPATGGAGSGSSGSGSGGGTGNSAEAIEEYSNCLKDAGQDLAKAQECAKLLTG